MVAAANGVGGDGCVRVRAREKEQRGGASRKSERGPRGLRGVAGGNQGRRRQPSREEVAGARGRARRARARVLLAREEDDRGGSGGGLGQREELGRAGKQVSGPGGRLPFYFCSVLFFNHCFLFVSICFDLVQTLNHFCFFQ